MKPSAPRLTLALMLFGIPALAEDPLATEPYQPLSPQQKAWIFTRRNIEPTSFGKSAFTAGIAQWRDSPEEWGQGMQGYGQRYGHRLVNRAFENAIGMGVAVALKQDPRYFRSGKQGVWRRVKHALLSTAATRNDKGDWTFPAWRLAGNYGSQLLSNTWRPDRQATVGEAMLRGSISLSYDAASNTFKEFWPDIRRKLFRK